MGKRVLVIASGDTERRALPHLLRSIPSDEIGLLGVVVPPRHRQITLDVACKLVLAHRFKGPDKIVVLLDADARGVDEVVAELDGLEARVGSKVSVPVLVTAAKWHLEAWFFADEQGLRNYLGRSLGHVDASDPDAIENPKHHLEQILGDRLYTSMVADEIARAVDPGRLGRSPSFNAFRDAVANGAG